MIDSKIQSQFDRNFDDFSYFTQEATSMFSKAQFSGASENPKFSSKNTFFNVLLTSA